MMKPAYIISAYKRTDLLVRLVDTLSPAPTSIHVDAKSGIFADVRSAVGGRPNVDLLPRHVCHWGLFGHVAASLEGLRWFMTTDCDYVTLLTAQCYPIKSAAHIESFLQSLNGKSCIDMTPLPRPSWKSENGGFDRLQRYHVRRPYSQRPLPLPLLRRTVPLGLKPFGGFSYWCLSRSAVQTILAYVDEHPQVVRFFKGSLIPDELFFHTILGNSSQAKNIVPTGVHHFHFEPNSPNPDLMGFDSLPEIATSRALFARKFDDHAVLDRIDAMRESAVAFRQLDEAV